MTLQDNYRPPSTPRRQVTFKADPDEQDAAEQALPAGRTMTGFLRACMRALAADRDALLPLLEPHWFERRAGRPRDPRSRRSRTGAYTDH